ncbi:type II toxin-antitoxin system RelE/ParE family toxin [Candidatus Methylomirabilis sp.]|uniref:type II toxin-antitoxin system RelE/ParE family toxin n=1 Tax=Candidatus Methylomirabilis sp. TaxID=2032687 RepID=UPI002A606FB9|nr:type II toxin-antitoxin system RelE/ParE family toxin [Candidatus Methylomirabilis sp.]
MTSVRYHEAAEDELLHEIGYLELRANGLGRRFFAEVRRTEKLISQFPESAEEIRPGIRKRILQKFRYSLIYSIEEDVLLILAVAHHSRRPGYWVGRISSGM